MKTEGYPKVMLVKGSSDNWHKRVVIGEKNGKFISWTSAETMEEAETKTSTIAWRYAKEIEKPFPYDSDIEAQLKEIDTIKRKSDNTIFSVNDRILIKEQKRTATIEKIILKENNKVYIQETTGIIHSINDIERAKFLFYSHDGHSVYEKEGCYGVCIKSYKEDGKEYEKNMIYPDIGLGGIPDYEYWLTFKDLKKATEWVYRNRPRFSKNDIKNAIFHATVTDKFMSVDKFKNKLNVI